MDGTGVLQGAFGRLPDRVHSAIEGLDAWALGRRLEADSVGWLLWHLTRVQDDHVAEVAGSEQVCTPAAGWNGSPCRSRPRTPDGATAPPTSAGW